MRIISTTAALLLCGTSALAQVPTAPSGTERPTQGSPSATQPKAQLEEIVVTANRRSENLQTVPVAITAVSGKTLIASGIESPASLPRITPGLQINTSGSISSPYIRGVGTQYATLGLESSVATYFNGIYISRPSGGLLSFNDVDHIEVLKGPQGTLYGRNAAAGAISIITHDPVDRWEGNIAAVGGTYGLHGGEGVLNIPVSDTLAFRFTGRYRDRDAYMKRAYADQPKIKGSEDYEFSAKALWTPTDRLKVKLGLYYSRLEESDLVAFSNLDTGLPELAGEASGGRPKTGFYTASDNSDFTPDHRNEPPRESASGKGANLRIDYDLGFARLASISGYHRSFSFATADFDATDVPLLNQIFIEQSSSYSQEVQLLSKTNSPLTWIIGAYYFQENGHNVVNLFGDSINQAFGVPIDANTGYMVGEPNLNLFARVRVKSFAPYAQATWEFLPKLKLTAGLRYTIEHKKLLYNREVADNVGPSELVLLDENDVGYNFHKLTPKITLSYEPHPGLMAYATYSEGFKSGGVATPTTAPQRRIAPEDLKSYEVGAKIGNRAARLDVAAFYYNYTNLQVQIRDAATGLNFVQNAASAHIYGAEAEGTIVPARGLELGAGLAYLHAHYQQYLGTGFVPSAQTAGCATAGGAAISPIPAACLGYTVVPQDYAGTQLTNAPTWQAHGRVTYDAALPGGSTLTVNGLANYQGSYFQVAGALREPAKVLFNGSLTWTSENKRYFASIIGENLSNKKYYNYRTQSGFASYGVVGMPRMISFKIGYNF